MRRNLILLLLLAVIFLASSIFLPIKPSFKTENVFTVEKGEGSRDIALNLEKQGLIRWAPVFRLYVLSVGAAGSLQAGNYFLSPAMNIPEIAGKLARGETAKINVTIPEGFTIKKIEEKLNITIDPKLEGFLFPDTYQFAYGASSEEIIRAMRENFENKITPDLREEIEKQGKTIFEIITMASIIEKEVISFEDRQIVSGIFWKRLNVEMPLDSCATIAYILGVDKWRYSFADTRIPSPYNTYLNQGLPAGPICNPGLVSIEAALYPKESQYWYYLSAPDGKTYFSKTLEEQNLNKAKYLK